MTASFCFAPPIGIGISGPLPFRTPITLNENPSAETFIRQNGA